MDVDEHAAQRLLERAVFFGLEEDEANRRLWTTLRTGSPARKHLSEKYTTYVRYFSDNLSMYVVFHEARNHGLRQVRIKTVIVEVGRP